MLVQACASQRTSSTLILQVPSTLLFCFLFVLCVSGSLASLELANYAVMAGWLSGKPQQSFYFPSARLTSRHHHPSVCACAYVAVCVFVGMELSVCTH